jgi:hypothetical protein
LSDFVRRRRERVHSLERPAIETALATVYALMTGDLAHSSDVVARDLKHWLERSKHLAVHITAASARPTRTIQGDVERRDVRVG